MSKYDNYRMKTKSDIRSGYLIELTNGERFILFRYDQSRFRKVFVNFINNTTIEFDDYDYDFDYGDSDNRLYNIEKVYGLPDEPKCYENLLEVYNIENRPLLWTRKPVEMTLEEIENKLGYTIRIVSKKED